MPGAADPAHPEHAYVREWLDLDDGETLDAAAFDPAVADQRPARLHRSWSRAGGPWAGHELPVHIDQAELWDDAATVVDPATARAGSTDLGSWTADQIGIVAAAAVERDDPELLTAVPFLLAFLTETGRWHGTGAQLDAALQAAAAASSPLRCADRLHGGGGRFDRRLGRSAQSSRRSPSRPDVRAAD